MAYGTNSLKTLSHDIVQCNAVTSERTNGVQVIIFYILLCRWSSLDPFQLPSYRLFLLDLT